MMSLPFLALKLGDKMVQYSVHAFSVVVQQLQKCPFPSTFLQQKTENLERHTERKRIRGYFWTRYVALLELMAHLFVQHFVTGCANKFRRKKNPSSRCLKITQMSHLNI